MTSRAQKLNGVLGSLFSQANAIGNYRRLFLHLVLADEYSSANKFRLAIAEVAQARRHAAALLIMSKRKSMASAIFYSCCAHLDSFGGYLFLEMGNLDNAERSFNFAQTWFCLAHNAFKEHSSSMESCSRASKMCRFSNSSATWPFSLRHNPFTQAALIAFASGRCAVALRLFDWATREVYPDMKCSSSARAGDTRDVADIYQLSFKSNNNVAICAVHVCDLEAAVWLLEGLVHNNPIMHLDQSLAFNLCTMYDLSTYSPRALQRKRLLHQVATVFQIAGLEVSAFRF